MPEIPGLSRGKGGSAPGLLVAALAGDSGFLSLAQNAFDLSDRGVTGRDPPAGLDAATVVGAAVVIINLLQACSFHPRSLETPQDVYAILDMSPYVAQTEADRWTVIDDALLKVEHGWSCAEARARGVERVRRAAHHRERRAQAQLQCDGVPERLAPEYKNSDHHVIGLGSTIFNIAQLNNRWSGTRAA
jgi:hypothetical protein